jgi:hypothetical protein
MALSSVQADRRLLPDRRNRPTHPFSPYTLTGRRCRNRRLRDPQAGYYVDRVDGPFAWALILVAALIGFDTSSTLVILGCGGLELNPIMAWLLKLGPVWFVLAKVLPPLIVIPLLALHRNFRVGLVGIRLLLYPYAGLSVIHFAILRQVFS